MLWWVLFLLLAIWIARFGFSIQHWSLNILLAVIWIAFVTNLLRSKTHRPTDAQTHGR